MSTTIYGLVLLITLSPDGQIDHVMSGVEHVGTYESCLAWQMDADARMKAEFGEERLTPGMPFQVNDCALHMTDQR